VESPTTVILVRHADIDGPAQDASELNDAGLTRRDELRHVLGDAGIEAILVSPVVRSRQTAEAVAHHLGLTPQVVDAAHLSAGIPTVIQAIRDLAPTTAAVLVVAHSNTLGGIIEGLDGPAIDPIESSAFDHLFVYAGGVLTHLRYGA
jgi:phosphohistidine phosphatase SixA